MATWAKGLDFKNSTNTKVIGGVGVYGTDKIANKIYIGLGADPWNGKGVEITESALTFKGNKVYHQGNKPTASEIGAAEVSHKHGLLNNDFSCFIPSTGTDNGWSMINSSYNGFLLKSIRTQQHTPSWILGDYAAGVAFGGADTKGVLSLAYKVPHIRFAGGNGTGPVWWMGLTGGNGKTYNFDSFNAASATILQNSRYLKIGNSAKQFNGSSDINWSLSEIGAASSSHSHDNYVSGSGLNGSTTVSDANNIWKSGFYDLIRGANVPFGDWIWLLNVAHGSNSPGYRYGLQIAAQNGTSNFAMRTTDATGTGNWRTLWHTGNFDPNSKSNSNHTHTDKASLGANVSFHTVHASSNGQGDNFAIGDDCWLGDINEYATVKLQAQDGSGKGFLRFGNGGRIGYNGRTALEFYGDSWFDNIAASAVDATILRISNSHGTPNFYNGGYDGATWGASNIHLNCWYGFGIHAYDNKPRIVFNARTGDIGATGNIYIQDGHSEGRISGFEPNRGNGRSRIAQGTDYGSLRIELFNGHEAVGEYVFEQGSFWTKNYAPLGNASFRWGQVYSTSGSISTSDSRLKENIKPISKNNERILNDDDNIPTSYDFYNYIKESFTYTFNYKREYTEDTQTWLGVLADEIPDNIFDKIGTWSKTDEEYQEQLKEKQEAMEILEGIPQPLYDNDNEEYDFGNKIVEGTRLTFRELKQKAHEKIEKPVRMINSSAQIAMLQEVLAVALNKIEMLEGILKEKGLY